VDIENEYLGRHGGGKVFIPSGQVTQSVTRPADALKVYLQVSQQALLESLFQFVPHNVVDSKGQSELFRFSLDEEIDLETCDQKELGTFSIHGESKEAPPSDDLVWEIYNRNPLPICVEDETLYHPLPRWFPPGSMIYTTSSGWQMHRHYEYRLRYSGDIAIGRQMAIDGYRRSAFTTYLFHYGNYRERTPSRFNPKSRCVDLRDALGCLGKPLNPEAKDIQCLACLEPLETRYISYLAFSLLRDIISPVLGLNLGHSKVELFYSGILGSRYQDLKSGDDCDDLSLIDLGDHRPVHVPLRAQTLINFLILVNELGPIWYKPCNVDEFFSKRRIPTKLAKPTGNRL